MKVQLKYTRPDLLSSFPNYGTPGSAGLDLRAAIAESVRLEPNTTVSIPTGLSIYLEDPNCAAMILPRSGLGSKGLVIGNLVGLIDSDYQGELTITAWNRSNAAMTINPGDRIAQLIIVPILHAEFDVVEDFHKSTARGTGGYGSTGVK